jgi:phospholipid transport system substrate-binding protein
MAQRTLGIHWRSASEAERARFVELFKRLLAERYMEDINRFRGDEQVLVRAMHKEADAYRVDTVIITHSREEVPISYFLHDENGGFRVHDFSIEGVSLVNHYRQSFNRFLVNESLGALIEKLARKAPNPR